MKKFIFLLMLSSVLLSENFQAIDLQASGIFRLSDFISLSQTQYYSPDGFFNYLSFNSMNDYQHQNSSLYINDHEIFYNFLGTKNLNSLPINIHSIDSISLNSAPTYFEGNFTNDGNIYFQLSQQKNLSIKNNLSYGNESKDTGPFRYTKYLTPNVDKVGSEFNNTITFNNIQSNFHYRQHIFTDWATRHRISNLQISKNFPMSIEYGLSLYNEGKLLDSEYSIFASSMISKDMYFYSPLAGHELPMDYQNNHFGFIANRSLTRERKFKFKLAYENVIAGDLISENQIGINHLKTQFIINQTDHNIIEAFGVNYHYQDLISNDNTSAQQLSYPEFFINVWLPKLLFDKLTFSEHLKLHKNELYDSYLITGKKEISQSTQIIFSLSKSDFLKQLDINDLWGKNYNIITKGTGKVPQKYTTDIQLNNQLTPYLSIDIKFYARLFNDYNYFLMDYKLDDSTFAFISDEIHFTKASGIVQGFSPVIQFTPSKNFQMKIQLTIQDYLSDEKAFLNIWRQIPKQSFNYTLQYRYNPTFSVWLNFRYNSSTQWVEFQNISGQKIYTTYNDELFYDYKIGANKNLSIKLRKTFWQNRVAANLFSRICWIIKSANILVEPLMI